MVKDEPSESDLRMWGWGGKEESCYSLRLKILRGASRRGGKDEPSFGHDEFEVPRRHLGAKAGS